MQKINKIDNLINQNKISKILINKNYFFDQIKSQKFDKRISIKIIGGYTINDFTDWLSIFCGNNSIYTDFSDHQWGAGFSSLNIQGINKHSKDYLIIINSWRDLFSQNNFNNLLISPVQIIKIFKNLLKNNKSKTIITTFDYPDFDIIVNKINLKQIILYLNYEIYKLFENNYSYSIIDEQHNILSKNIEWYSPRDWHSFGKIITSESALLLAFKISKIIGFSILPAKKLIILDMDNTIWGGVIGDDGLKNLKIGEATAEGRVFYELQSYFKMISNKGILMAIVSKNEKKNVLEGLKSKKNILNFSDFVTSRINWKDKSENILSIAKELNLGVESFVFIDDNPFERDLVKKKLPEVSVPDIGSSPENYIKIINDFNFFNINSKTLKEDLHRSSMYKAEQIRKKIKIKNTPIKNFLKSLKIEINYLKDFNNNLERIHQLTNKTNQFNLTTERLDFDKIRSFKRKPNKEIVVVHAKDKYGDYGIISIVYLTKNITSLQINNWVMSCRVFNKSIESAIIYSLVKMMKKKNIKKINLKLILSKKNHLMIKILEKIGFSLNKKFSKIKSEWLLESKKIKHECIIKNEI
ncbi:HAD-IIIC family phosphatase [Candidatus Pelagibacter sp.]|jgi:FkbH-like protein|nr:HAD-IIIC family phosphatase [Candidatus Pelagibacter sp.]